MPIAAVARRQRNPDTSASGDTHKPYSDLNYKGGAATSSTSEREKLDEEDDGDGAFGRMVADYDSRSRGNMSGEPVTNLERDSIGS
jgi:hypothetical protein